MSKGFRIFEAPSCELPSLPIEDSPWHFERDTQIPLGHWEIIIEFAKRINGEKAEMLEKYSVGSLADDDYIQLTENITNNIIDFMILLKHEISVANKLYELRFDVFNDIHEEYDNAEYQKMLDAVIAVYKESRRLNKPICAYND